uniref:1-phosphatidylinositol 4-kinase n=1 Tax=Kalanchoe fedtschenkoi TaxID=63787 RepID=A0A7N0TEH3_KALFE
MGPEFFPINEVHKISVLDIRLANADRHAGNILVRKDKENGCLVLIPIDHGYCLPESFEDCTFDWLYWPQARKPFSADTLNYIKSLDAEEDIALLKFYGWDIPKECARTRFYYSHDLISLSLSTLLSNVVSLYKTSPNVRKHSITRHTATLET